MAASRGIFENRDFAKPLFYYWIPYVFVYPMLVFRTGISSRMLPRSQVQNFFVQARRMERLMQVLYGMTPPVKFDVHVPKVFTEI
ncbi:hypothetical protein Y032_0002g792 [Ancylostoma ceylanicum]|uniref:Uncharacterized protein n=1 Tax=Ancylostoma ceylanicum TaxID=53326 RepID=A0A016W2A9_9BILA|nr:hypothetical protein Y032_0002g792 [Ancylostoma ceylanicum]